MSGCLWKIQLTPQLELNCIRTVLSSAISLGCCPTDDFSQRNVLGKMQVNLFHAVSYHRKQLQFVHQFGKTKKTLFTVFLQYTIQKFEVSNAHQGCIHLI